MSVAAEPVHTPVDTRSSDEDVVSASTAEHISSRSPEEPVTTRSAVEVLDQVVRVVVGGADDGALDRRGELAQAGQGGERSR